MVLFTERSLPLALNFRLKAETPSANQTLKQRSFTPNLIGAIQMKHNRWNRTDWLLSHGFKDDPFPKQAFRAETDPLLKRSNLSSFLLPPDFEMISDSMTSFIFMRSGAGKTSLRMALKDHFDRQFLMDNKRVVAVEYIDHHDLIHNPTRAFHEDRIATLVTDELGRRNLYHESPKQVRSANNLMETVNSGERGGLDKIVVLVELTNLAEGIGIKLGQNYIHSLVTAIDLLTYEGIAFKFILPREMLDWGILEWPMVEFQPIVIEWQQQLLSVILQQRLQACTLDKTHVTIKSLFDLSCSDSVDNKIAIFGELMGSPRAMWLLGRYIIDKHFEASVDHRRRTDELISRYTLDWALVEAEKDLKSLLLRWQYSGESSPNQFNDRQDELYEAIQLYKRGQRKTLRKLLEVRWNLNDLQVRAFDLNISYEELAGDTKERRLISFLEYLDQRGRLDELLDEV